MKHRKPKDRECAQTFTTFVYKPLPALEHIDIDRSWLESTRFVKVQPMTGSWLMSISENKAEQ